MKKNLVSIVVLALVAVTFVLACAPPIVAGEAQPSGFTALAPIPGLTDISPTAVVNSDSLANFFNNLYKYVIGIAAILAVIMIIWGGLEYSTQDSVSKKSDGKERILQAIFGLVLVLSPVLIFSIINPSILNLSLNLPELDTATGPPITAPIQAATPTTVGSGAPCNGLISARGNCTQTVFNDGTYPSPPKGAFCYQLKTPISGDTVFCFKNQQG